MKDFIDRGNQSQEEPINGAFKDLFEERLVTVKGKPTVQWMPRNESIIKHPSFLKILMAESIKAGTQRYRLDGIIEVTDSLKEAVDAELERLTGEPVEQISDE